VIPDLGLLIEVKLSQRMEAWDQLAFYSRILGALGTPIQRRIQVARNLRSPWSKLCMGPMDLDDVEDETLWILRI
jgi:hypothetical protein